MGAVTVAPCLMGSMRDGDQDAHVELRPGMELLWTWAAAWTDASPNVSRLDPSGAVEVDATIRLVRGRPSVGIALGLKRSPAQRSSSRLDLDACLLSGHDPSR